MLIKYRLKLSAGVAAAALLSGFATSPVSADTLEAALVRAYQTNPQLNAQRASVRSTDENVPQALSGYRPKVAVTASAGTQYTDTQQNTSIGDRLSQVGTFGTNAPRSVGATVTQTLFNGGQTGNRTRAAESQVSAAREGLRVLEQTVLLSAATIYMDYLRDSAIVEVQRSNVRVLEQTLKQTRDRFNVGEVTRTDVAQSEAQLAAGRRRARTSAASSAVSRRILRPVLRWIVSFRQPWLGPSAWGWWKIRT
jgi:outer membrane protein